MGRKLYWLDDDGWARIEPHLPKGVAALVGWMIAG